MGGTVGWDGSCGEGDRQEIGRGWERRRRDAGGDPVLKRYRSVVRSYSEDNSLVQGGDGHATRTSMSTHTHRPLKRGRGLGCSPSKSARGLGSHPRERGAF